MSNYQGPGIYKHYKGGEYKVLGLALHEHAKDNHPDFHPADPRFHQVVYEPMTSGSSLLGSPATMWVRRLSNFNEYILDGDDRVIPRFEKISDA